MTESARKLFRMAAIETSDGPPHILWTLDESGVRVLPWASHEELDQRRLGETISRVGSFADPRMPAEIVDLTRAGARVVELSEAQVVMIASEVAAALPVDATA